MRACVLHLWELLHSVDNVWFVLDFDIHVLQYWNGVKYNFLSCFSSGAITEMYYNLYE